LKFLPTALPGVTIVEPDVFRDERGFFLETFNAARYREGGIGYAFVQDNQSRSVRGTLRGLHAQRRRPQGKLVRAVRGEIFDVALDIRPGSPAFGQWLGTRLNESDFRQLFIPPGFAHGFCVLSEVAEVEYKCTEPYDRADEIGVRWDSAGIDWPVKEPLISPKDASLPTLAELRRMLES
jgi:dTDP-4-dehydrorhamnose 3,5-epimerase